ncbi:unnamed protein product (macronuclear) [Paramecium tetraurelia]|uniref:Protein kinase domain-containing protein n=1 Tax=Paramecium tetraurelia TaxID=5888 RepID=A0BF44_PARTE|nr:uncharacterized protein GSPATT00028196001 [Paramecium tetraurelia]CAK57161.1 unnamed protein product [Paramecium tetraurelia]|eukprot:XP_001424559.1 hypothetical protein (macronuclear) [Paramecium tetraurelia strain d4-2]
MFKFKSEIYDLHQYQILMGVCSSTKKSSSKNSQDKFNPALANTADVQQTQRDHASTQNEQKINQNLTVQRKIRKSGTLSYFEYNQDKLQAEKRPQNNKKVGSSAPQLKIKITDSIASKEYSVYKGHVKIPTKATLRVMQHNSDGQLVVMEQLPYDQEGKDYIDWLQKTNLEFYHIAKVQEIFVYGHQFQIMHEYCTGGPLSELLHHKLSEQVVCTILDQLFKIVNFLHQNKLTHNKLTIDSFSFYYDLQNYLIKLTDLSSLHKPPREISLQIAQYASPEALTSNNPHRSNDIWSLGIIAYQLMTRNLIYEEDQDLTNIHEVKKAIIKWTKKYEINDEISQEFENLILMMLNPDKTLRLTIEECIDQEFIQNYQSQNLNCHFKHLFTSSFCDNLQKQFMIYLINNYERSHQQVGRRIFDILDKDKDGKLNIQELEDFKRRLKQAQGQERNIQVIQNLIDTQSELGLEDFILIISNKSIYLTHHNLDHSFAKFGNKNQEVTVKTLSKILNIQEEELTQEFKNRQFCYQNYCIPLEKAQYEQILNSILEVQSE